MPDAIVWLQRYGDNLLIAVLSVAGSALNLGYIRNCPPGVARTLKVVAAVALGYNGVLHFVYVTGARINNEWFGAAAIVLTATLALNAWVGRHRGECD